MLPESQTACGNRHAAYHSPMSLYFLRGRSAVCRNAAQAICSGWRLALLTFVGLAISAAAANLPPEYRQAIEADWARQESRLGRTAESMPALRAAVERATTYSSVESLRRWQEALDKAGDMPAPVRLALYQQSAGKPGRKSSRSRR